MIFKQSNFFKVLILSLMLLPLTLPVFAGGQSEKIEAKEDSVTLTMMNFFVNENATGKVVAYHHAMDKFRAGYPDIVIDEEILGHDSYQPKIKTLAAANELPDLFLIKGSMVSTFVENGLINPMNEILDKDTGWNNSFVEGAFDDFKMGNDIYGIPMRMTSTHVIYYNKEIFDECGIKSFPATWDEFKSVITKLKDKGYTPIALGNKAKWPAESCILSALGDRFTGTDWFRSIRDRKGAKFTDTEFVNALTAMQELAQMDAFNSDMNSIETNQQKAMYCNRKAGMFIEGGWAVSALNNMASSEIIDATEVAIFPAVEGGNGDSMAVSGGAGWAYGISSKVQGEKKAAAVSLLKTLTSMDTARVCIENNEMPATIVESYDKSKVSSLFNKYVELISGTKFVPVYDVQLTPPVIEVMNSGLQELLIDVITPLDLAKKIQAEYEKQ